MQWRTLVHIAVICICIIINFKRIHSLAHNQRTNYNLRTLVLTAVICICIIINFIRIHSLAYNQRTNYSLRTLDHAAVICICIIINFKRIHSLVHNQRTNYNPRTLDHAAVICICIVINFKRIQSEDQLQSEDLGSYCCNLNTQFILQSEDQVQHGENSVTGHKKRNWVTVPYLRQFHERLFDKLPDKTVSIRAATAKH